MISPADFVNGLRKNGFSDFTGVPCSFFQAAINCVIDSPGLSYTMVPNEGAALAFAVGAHFGGKRTAVLIQNSGFGNLINPLTSLNMIYKVPALIFISGRAYGVEDEPQHAIIGKAMGPLCDAIGVPHADMPLDREAFEKSLAETVRAMDRTGLPFIFFVRKDTIDEYTCARPDAGAYPLKRVDAIRVISECAGAGDCLIATTGKPSRELFAVADRPGNFYMQGSMGHAPSIGLGLALARPDKKVVVLDGDGALLMHLGALSSIGHYAPPNFAHIVLDNEAYETTGNQDTTSRTTDFRAMALAAGYRAAEEASDEAGLRAALGRLLTAKGPVFLRVKINRVPTDKIPRISNKYSSEDITKNFKNAVARS